MIGPANISPAPPVGVRTPAQNKRIWALVSTLGQLRGMDRDAAETILRALVREATRGKTDRTRALTEKQAGRVIRDLDEAIHGNLHPSPPSPSNGSGVGGEGPSGGPRYDPTRYADCDGRSLDMATGAQLRKIEALWMTKNSRERTDASLRAFLEHKFGASDLRFLSRRQASKAITALEDSDEASWTSASVGAQRAVPDPLESGAGTARCAPTKPGDN